jgi:hypothetical protein
VVKPSARVRRAIVISVAPGFRSRVEALLERRGLVVFATALPAAARRGLRTLARSGLALPVLVVVDGQDSAAVDAATLIASDPSLRKVHVTVVSGGPLPRGPGSEPTDELASVVTAAADRATASAEVESSKVASTGKTRPR